MNRSPVYRAAFVLACLAMATATWLAISISGQAPVAPPTVSRETTFFTGPVRADGSLDFAAAINMRLGEGVQPEDNACVFLQRAFGPSDYLPPAFYEALQMETPPVDGKYLRDVESKRLRANGASPERVHELFEQYGELVSRPWKREECPELANWLADNEEPLQVVHEAAKRDSYYLPLVWQAPDGQGSSEILIQVRNVSIPRMRTVLRTLCCRAMLRLGEDDTEGAWSDLLACRRLGRLFARGPTLVDTLTAHTAESASSKGMITLLETTRPSIETIQRYRGDLKRVPSMQDVSDVLNVFERCSYLDAMLGIALSKFDASQALGSKSGITPAMARVVDWDEALRRGNDHFDRLVAATRLPTHAERRSAIAEVHASFTDFKSMPRPSSWKSRKKNAHAIADLVGALMMPATLRVRDSQDRLRQTATNIDLVLALLEFQDRHDRYPESLDELVPDFLTKSPVDVFTDDALVYRRTDAGFLLYSVGPNMMDDGGLTDRKTGADDVSVLMDGHVDVTN